jgi:hypothetical protein
MRAEPRGVLRSDTRGDTSHPDEKTVRISPLATARLTSGWDRAAYGGMNSVSDGRINEHRLASIIAQHADTRVLGYISFA